MDKRRIVSRERERDKENRLSDERGGKRESTSLDYARFLGARTGLMVSILENYRCRLIAPVLAVAQLNPRRNVSIQGLSVCR